MGETALFIVGAYQMFSSRFIYVVYINVGSRKGFFRGKQLPVLPPGYTLFVTLRKLAYFSPLSFLWPKNEVN